MRAVRVRACVRVCLYKQSYQRSHVQEVCRTGQQVLLGEVRTHLLCLLVSLLVIIHVGFWLRACHFDSFDTVTATRSLTSTWIRTASLLRTPLPMLRPWLR